MGWELEVAGRASDSEASQPSGEGALWARRCFKRGAAGGAGREKGVSQGRKTERCRLYTERPCSSRGAPPPGPRPSLRGSRVTARKPRRRRAPCCRRPGLWPLPGLRGPSGQDDTRCPPRPSRQEENVHWGWESQGAFPENPLPEAASVAVRPPELPRTSAVVRSPRKSSWCPRDAQFISSVVR